MDPGGNIVRRAVKSRDVNGEDGDAAAPPVVWGRGKKKNHITHASPPFVDAFDSRVGWGRAQKFLAVVQHDVPYFSPLMALEQNRTHVCCDDDSTPDTHRAV